MNKLQILKAIGESYARTNNVRLPYALRFFNKLATEMYPMNKHRREWAVSNLEMFYVNECERIIIMNKLSNTTDFFDVIVKEIMDRR